LSQIGTKRQCCLTLGHSLLRLTVDVMHCLDFDLDFHLHHPTSGPTTSGANG